jgi:hypothetical protein
MSAGSLFAHSAGMALTRPPHPGFQATLLTAARSRAWLPVAGELGSIEGHSITVESADEDRSRWAAEPGAELPGGFAPRLLTKDTYTALREGELGQDGVLTWQGKRWTLLDAWDGARLVARLEPLPK